MYSNDDQGRIYKIVNLMTPRGGIFVLVRDLIMKMQYFFSILVHARAWIRQSKYKAKATKEGSARIVNFMTIEAGGLMLERGYISH